MKSLHLDNCRLFFERQGYYCKVPEPVNCYWIEITLLTVKYTINTVCIWSMIVQVLHQYLPGPCMIMYKCCFLVKFLYLVNEWISHQFLVRKLLGLFLGLEVDCSDRCLMFYFRVLENAGSLCFTFYQSHYLPFDGIYSMCLKKWSVNVILRNQHPWKVGFKVLFLWLD